jgi:hypothetical protein
MSERIPVYVLATNQAFVIAGLDPAIPIMWHGRVFINGMAGSSPAMTVVS